MKNKKKSLDTQVNNKKQKGHSEFELVFVVIMVGLLGIGVFLYIVNDGLNTKFSNSDVVAVAQNPDDVVGRDNKRLGLRIDTNLGKFFIHPESQKTLYINKKRECYNDCLVLFQPLYAEEPFDNGEGATTIRRTDGTLQLSWKGKGLYTFIEDSNRSTLADKYPKGWEIARP
jgi:hypothetical protein